MTTTIRHFPLDLAQLPGMLFGAQVFRVEEYTEGDTYVVRAEAPGVRPEKDVAVSVLGDRLFIRIERTDERAGKTHTEFHYGSFARTVQLPLTATDEGASATYADGILEVRVPLAGKVTPGHEIPVTTK